MSVGVAAMRADHEEDHEPEGQRHREQRQLDQEGGLNDQHQEQRHRAEVDGRGVEQQHGPAGTEAGADEGLVQQLAALTEREAQALAVRRR